MKTIDKRLSRSSSASPGKIRNNFILDGIIFDYTGVYLQIILKFLLPFLSLLGLMTLIVELTQHVYYLTK